MILQLFPLLANTLRINKTNGVISLYNHAMKSPGHLFISLTLHRNVPHPMMG